MKINHKIRVGYFNRTRYWQTYAFDNPPKDVVYRRAIDVPFHKIGINNQFLRHTKLAIPYQRLDVFHTYNSIVTFSRKPWIVEVETKLPRFGTLSRNHSLFKWGINRINSEACQAVLFTSESAKGLNSDNFESWGIDPGKCHVLYRAVETHERRKQADANDTFDILFVGNAFFRKGGLELIRAFQDLSEDFVRLNIVSSLEVDWRIKPSQSEIDFVKARLETDPRITWTKSLPHGQVVDLMRRSDVLVCTTFGDPFNNVVLEGQACGLPTIASTERAIPEIVEDGLNGFLIDAKQDDRESIVEFIANKIRLYMHDKKLLGEHQQNCYDVVESRFLSSHRNQRLKKIYEDAVAK